MPSSSEEPDHLGWAAPARRLGELLTGTQAKGIADRLADDDTLTVAVQVVPAGLRSEIRALLAAVGPANIAVLRSIEGARAMTSLLEPRWTMPGHVAKTGPLTSSVIHLVNGARQSITCSTFNFQRTSGLWDGLRHAAHRPEISLRVYLDTSAADHSIGKSPTTAQVAAHLYPGIVMRTRKFDGKVPRNHAKFLVVDHRFLLTTSANFSWSAEQGNVEFGIYVDDRNLAESVELEILNAEEFLFEQIFP